ncbi:hypothetical protein Syun_016113 [Stephania yunnanensis]|uniref:Lipoyl-binding domain-containing protein n=1 Tax=Stephania yunnanensis TaxID=152371 RepID=A0AAP0P4K0_9MAGN
MESVAALRSLQCSLSTAGHVHRLVDRSGITMCNTTLSKLSFTQGQIVGRRLTSFPVSKSRTCSPHIKASEAASAATSDEISSDGSLEGLLDKKNTQSITFPSGFEALVLEVCDETEIAELKLKVGDFEMNLKRNIGANIAMAPAISPVTAPPIPSKPMIDSAPAAAASPSPKLSPQTSSPFKNVGPVKSPKLVALEASGASGYVLVPSPTVGSFRRGRTVKGKRQPPICKEGIVIKEGQVIGYLDQFGSELPVKSDVAGEVIKLLYDDGDAIGYGDPLIAVLPSFHGIN